jgi:hypothetical protein
MSDKPSTEELILNARAGIEHSKREGEVMFDGLNAPSMSSRLREQFANAFRAIKTGPKLLAMMKRKNILRKRRAK